MGVYGEILWGNDRIEFELDRARSKINIAENSFALGHETHNRLVCAFEVDRHLQSYCREQTDFVMLYLFQMNHFR